MTKTSSASHGGVVLVMNAGEDAGHRIARDLLRDGYRVVVTSRHATQLIPILHGDSAERVMAVAADTSNRRQVEELLRRVESRFGRPVDAVVCATGMNGDETSGRDNILTIVPNRAWPQRRTRACLQRTAKRSRNERNRRFGPNV